MLMGDLWNLAKRCGVDMDMAAHDLKTLSAVTQERIR
jgi:hypothetical protein